MCAYVCVCVCVCAEHWPRASSERDVTPSGISVSWPVRVSAVAFLRRGLASPERRSTPFSRSDWWRRRRHRRTPGRTSADGKCRTTLLPGLASPPACEHAHSTEPCFFSRRSCCFPEWSFLISLSLSLSPHSVRVHWHYFRWERHS